MAARYPEAPVIATTQNPRQISLTDLTRTLEYLTQQVAERKKHLRNTFRQIHQMVAKREMALLAELDAIPAEITVKINERTDFLEQLTKNRDDTERELNANRLNALVQNHLENIKEEMEKIISEQIAFPYVSVSCEMEEIEKTLGEKCRILKLPNPYACRTLPIWHEVKEGEEDDHLYYPTAVCIDPTSQLIYVGEFYNQNGRIQVFTSEGKHCSTLRNPLVKHCRSMKIHKGHIYLTTSFLTKYFLKLNEKGETIKKVTLGTPARGISIEELDIYTCISKTRTVQIFDLNLKPTKKVILEAISFNEDTTPQVICLHKQQMFVLFNYCVNNYHPDPVQVFKLDGTLIRSLVTGNYIKHAWYFCLDSYENILVSDYCAHCIRIFSQDGILIQNVGREGKREAGDLWYPQGISVDYNKRIIIVDWKEENMLQVL